MDEPILYSGFIRGYVVVRFDVPPDKFPVSGPDFYVKSLDEVPILMAASRIEYISINYRCVT